MASILNFSGYSPTPVVKPPKVLGKAFNPDLLKDVPAELEKNFIQGVKSFGKSGTGGSADSYQVLPEYAKYAVKVPYIGKSGGGGQTKYYEIPTGKTYQDKPLVARYDTQGNFQFVTFPEDQFLRIDPSNPDVISQPKINKNGEIIDYGINVQGDFGGSGIGGFVSDIAKDFSPMILAGFGADALAGSGLFTGGAGAAAAGGASAAEIAASNALASANLAGYAGTELAATAAGAGLLSGGATAADIAASNALAQANLTGYAGTALPAIPIEAGLLSGAGADLAASEALANNTLAQANMAAQASGGFTASGAAGTGVTSSMLSAISKATGIDVDTLKTFAPSVIQGLIGAGGSYLTSEQAKESAQTQSDAQIRAAQIAADAARFRPVGVTTRFGSSNFTTDAAGNVTGAGYTPSAEITGYQDRLRTVAGQGMTDIEGARAAYQPLTGAAQSLFGLGQGYLAKTPEQAAQDYISKQQALLAPSQQNRLAEVQNKLFQQGRGGAATAQGGNLMATSPELAAYYNSIAQQDLVLAAQADEEARRRISYGAGLFDTGANLQGRFYTGQTAAYSPFATAMDTSSGLERLAQQPLDLSTSIGQKVSTANANVGRLTSQGITSAAQTMAPANAYSLGGNLFAGAANSPNVSGALNKAFGVTPDQPTYTQQQLIDILLGNKQKSVFAT